MQDHDIVRQCQNGNQNAFKTLYDRYGQSLLRTALRMLQNQHDAEDAVQTTFVKLYRSMKNFRYESKFSTYLFRILMNVCFDQIAKRNKMRMETLDHVIHAADPKHDLRMQLDEAISSLPDQQRACFFLFAVEELKQDEIAYVMDLSLGGVKSNIFHAKKHLRKVLAEDSKGVQ